MITLAALIIGGFLLPPLRFDHKPAVPFSVNVVAMPLFKAACRADIIRRTIIGCTYGGTIFIRADLSPQARRMVLRHEYGHVNGWPASHVGGVALR